MAGVLSRLYTGTGAFDIVGRRRLWYALFGALMLVCVASIVLRGFNLGVDFTGGTLVQFPAAGASAPVDVESVRGVFERVVGTEPTVQVAGSGAAQAVLIRSETLDPAQLVALKQALFDTFQPIGASGQPAVDAISDSAVSGSWGGQITRQALIALGVFLVLVTVFLALYFERSMAIAALIALIHDVVVTAGIYSIIGFEVTPSTVIGLLTILGFSLYDTVVVFDKVTENTRGLLGLSRRTYGEAANLALNQTLMRSINTSLIAVLPVLGLLVIGVGLLGVGTLADLALVQMVGIIAGALSSLLLATPLLVDLKLRDPKVREQAERVRKRRAHAAARQGAPVDADGDAPGDVPGEVTGDGAEPDLADDAVLGRELRRERAMSAASAVPARPGKSGSSAARPTGKRRR
jgi:preprotein translocase subunit SecF